MWHLFRTMTREVGVIRNLSFVDGFIGLSRILIPLDGFMNNI